MTKIARRLLLVASRARVDFGSDSAPELKAFAVLDSMLFSTSLDSLETLRDKGELDLLDCAVQIMGHENK